MRQRRLPASRSLSLAAVTIAGLLAMLAVFSPDPDHGALLLPILSASIIGLIAFVAHQRLVTFRLRQKADELKRNVDFLEEVEELAGFGRWCVELDPRRHLWSEEMCHLAGLSAGTAPRQEILEKIMPDGLQHLELAFEAHAHDSDTYAIEFEVCQPAGETKILRARARNIFAPDGRREQVFMVARDVTEDYALRRDREEALEIAQQAQEVANTDVLTGLGNRRFAMAQLDRLSMEARTTGLPLSIVVFDIDHFKQVNDRYGHPAGDKVLVLTGDIAARQARESDIVGRIGGEEFLWIMPGCDQGEALRAAERLRWAVEAGTLSAPVPAITISAGHAEFEPEDAALTLFARADSALYEAKRAGRNRVKQAA